MFRNVESHFSKAPQVNIERSVIDRPSTHKTSFNFGDLIPLYVDPDILPGDTVDMTTSKIVRLQTMLTPILDDMYFDIYWFFVPHRLVWSHWKEFMGENTQSAWIQQTQYAMPTISSPSGGFNTGTIADYMGLPVGVQWSATDAMAPMALPFRAYALVCNEWFRSEAVTDPLLIQTGDSNQTGSNGSSYRTDVDDGGMPFKVAKYFDYFTSMLPGPQKSAPVTFPLISGTSAPVFAGDEHGHSSNAVRLRNQNGNAPTGNHFLFSTNPSNTAWSFLSSGTTSTGTVAIDSQPANIFSNLWADLSTSVGAVTVNELRLAFQLQKFAEKMALGGSRYTEQILVNFGVQSPDSRLQRPEYLGGNRIAINVHEVTNSAQSTQDFLGDLGAKSATADSHSDFVHSFTEHGTLLCVGCARYTHSYGQGIERSWLRKTKESFYWPVFAALGNQPVYDVEWYADANTIANDTVAGYQEAWAEYRYKPSRVSGEMRPGISNTLASWHLADYYTQKPTLSDGWIREDKNIVDRVLAVTSSVSNQVFGDFYFDAKYTRPMPVYSIPGLIDHF